MPIINHIQQSSIISFNKSDDYVINIKFFKEEVFPLSESQDLKELILDVSELDFINSTLLAYFYVVHKNLKEKFTLINVNKKVYEVLEIMKLERIFNIKNRI